jgi:tetratricopeptide (TPR) repeat protein
MVRPVSAFLGGVLLLVGWLVWVAHEAHWRPAEIASSLADSAARCRLPGLSARGHLLAAELLRRELHAGRLDRASAAGRSLVREIAAERLAAARILLDEGYPGAAEAVALEAARADFTDVAARALLLETRLQGPQADVARRELMLLLLEGENPRVLYVLGKALSSLDDSRDAASYLRRAQQLDPRYFPVYAALADLALSQHDRNAALSWLRQAAALARTGAEHAAVIQLRTQADPEFTSPQVALAQVRLWWQEHGLGALAALGYLGFLLSPWWSGPLRRRLRRPTSSPPNAPAG